MSAGLGTLESPLSAGTADGDKLGFEREFGQGVKGPSPKHDK